MKLIYKALVISLTLLLAGCGEMVIKYLPEITNDLNYINNRLDDKSPKRMNQFVKSEIVYVRYFYSPKDESSFLKKVEELAKEINYNTKINNEEYKNTLGYFCHDSVKYRHIKVLKTDGEIEIKIAVYNGKGYSSCVPKVK